MTEGINVETVTAWMCSHIEGCTAPLTFDLIAGGHSNLTYAVTDAAGNRFVLRRPPLGQVLKTAHDMTREHKILSGLAGTSVPVPPVLGLCSDETVNGSPFYVMAFVDGIILRTEKDADALDETASGAVCESLIDVMARIHSVDVDAVGLGDLGKREDYIGRQLRRWHGQYEQSIAQLNGRSVVDLAAIHDRLASSVPPQQRTGIVHGDYRLDNCLITPQGQISAVLDWEICTLGDPLADLGLLMVYWADPSDAAVLPQSAYLTRPGFWRRSQLLDAYQRATGADLSAIDFYVAFGYWKLGCIISGVYARYAGGSMGSDVPESAVEGFRVMLGHIADAATDAADRI